MTEEKPAPLGLSPEAAALKPPQKSAGRAAVTPNAPMAETGGPKGPEPTRFGDWEKKGRCTDF